MAEVKNIKPNSKEAAKLSKEDITLLLDSDDFAVRCLMSLYDYQTIDEKNAGTTYEYNEVGFNGVDAEILSSFAQQVQRFDKTSGYKQPLSLKQFQILRKKLPKYHKQLSIVLLSKGGAN